ncbi:hypothetical protein [Rhodococcus qingshengii]|jgi:hypothetical protein
MARADNDPAQAEAVMRPLQDESFRADCAANIAAELVESLESEIDTAFDAGNEAEVARLTELHLQAQDALEAAQQEVQSAENAIFDAHRSWFEEDED